MISLTRCKGCWVIFVLCVAVSMALAGCPDTTLPRIDETPAQVLGLTGGVICTAENVAPTDPNTLVAHFIDVGQGDGIWLRLPSGDPENPVDMIVDAGDGPKYSGDSTPDSGTVMADYLEAHGMEPGSTIDWLVVTHGDSDHFYGVTTLIGRFPVRNFIGSGYTETDNSWPLVRNEIKSKVEAVGGVFASPAIPILLAEHGALPSGVLGTTLVDVELLWGTTAPPVASSGSLTNNSAVVLKITMHGRSLLLTSDIGQNVEQLLVEADLRGEINLASHALKVAHHGSNTSSTATFLDAVFGVIPLDQRRGIIQSGRRSFGGKTLPRVEIVERLRTYLDEGHLLSTEHADEGKSSSESANDDHVVLTISAGGRIHLCYNPGGLVQSGDAENDSIEDELDNGF
jgi:beta-lactamase superfamily II metal-dependent hydrolase